MSFLMKMTVGLARSAIMNAVRNRFAASFTTVAQSKSSSLDEYLGRRYQLSSSERWEEFLSAVGVEDAKKSVSKIIKPTIELRRGTGDTLMLKTSVDNVNYVLIFTPGVEFESESPGGKPMLTTINVDKNQLLQASKGDILKLNITRTFSPERLEAVFRVGDLTSTRVYSLL